MKYSEKVKKKILDAALTVWPNTSLRSVGKAAGLTHSAVIYHFPDKTLKPAVIEHAVEIGHVKVIRQLIAQKHKAVSHFTTVERQKYFQDVL